LRARQGERDGYAVRLFAYVAFAVAVARLEQEHRGNDCFLALALGRLPIQDVVQRRALLFTAPVDRRA